MACYFVKLEQDVPGNPQEQETSAVSLQMHARGTAYFF
jgi:hypothetical protein